MSKKEQEASKHLVEIYSNLNNINENGSTLLHIASINGFTGIIELLLNSEGIDNHKQDAEGKTALILSIQNGHDAISNMLLDKNADVNIQDKKRNTAIVECVYLGNEKLFCKLVHFGADLDVIDEEGYSILHKACIGGSEYIVEYLLNTNNYDINQPNNKLVTPLHSAVNSVHLPIIKLLLKAGANINAKTDQGYTPINGFQLTGSMKITKYLVENGTYPDSTTELHSERIVSEDEYIQIIKTLLDAGADLHNLGCSEKNILYTAASKGYLEIVKLVSVQRQDINSKTHNSPLHIAAKNGHLDIVKYLIEEGMDFNSKDKFEKTPLQYACENNHLVIIKYLNDLTHDFNQKDDMFWAIRREKEEAALQNLLDKYPYVNFWDENGTTLLHIASIKGLTATVERLLHMKDIDIDKQDADENTALTLSIQHGHDAISNMLLDNNADVTIRDICCRTAVEECVYIGNEKLFHKMIQLGVDLDVTKELGCSLLSNACTGGSKSIVEYILNINKHYLDGTNNDILANPLLLAINSVHQPIIKLLLKAGANVNSRPFEDTTVLNLIELTDSILIAKYLVENGTYPGSTTTPYTLRKISENEYVQIIQTLLNAGADLHNLGCSEKNILHKVAAEGYLEVVKLVSDQRQDINFKTHDSPLHAAAKNGHMGVVKYLIEKGMDFNSKDKLEKTPLQYASENKHLEIINYLIDLQITKGDMPCATMSEDEIDNTALHHAPEDSSADTIM